MTRGEMQAANAAALSQLEVAEAKREELLEEMRTIKERIRDVYAQLFSYLDSGDFCQAAYIAQVIIASEATLKRLESEYLGII